MSDECHHEPTTEPSNETEDTHRGLTSLKEEMEVIDWYNHQLDSSLDKELAAILMHNASEEKKDLSMLRECIRKKESNFNKEHKSYLFSAKPKPHA